MSVVLSADVLKDLCVYQRALNEMIDKDWMNVRKLNDWSLAIMMETCEFLDSYPWKWWKAMGEIDIENAKIELVDILHFALAGAMQARYLASKIEPPAHPIEREKLVPNKPQLTVLNAQGAIDALWKITDLVVRSRNAHPADALVCFEEIVRLVFAAANELQLNIIGYYIAKHTLNIIRQIEGYKKGGYRKLRCVPRHVVLRLHNTSAVTTIDGKEEYATIEDNVLLHGCVKQVNINDCIGISKKHPVEEDNKKGGKRRGREGSESNKEYLKTWDTLANLVYEVFQIDKDDRRFSDSFF